MSKIGLRDVILIGEVREQERLNRFPKLYLLVTAEQVTLQKMDDSFAARRAESFKPFL